MKRAPELRPLSEDHHHGLVLARKARQAATGAGGEAPHDAWSVVEREFAAELEPHFRIEELLLAPVLRDRGEPELVRRLLDEHAALRQHVAPGAGRTADDLARFGGLLERHIRFEERELFPAAERCLGGAALRRVAEACRERRRT